MKPITSLENKGTGKTIDARFIKAACYPECIANIVQFQRKMEE